MFLDSYQISNLQAQTGHRSVRDLYSLKRRRTISSVCPCCSSWRTLRRVEVNGQQTTEVQEVAAGTIVNETDENSVLFYQAYRTIITIGQQGI